MVSIRPFDGSNGSADVFALMAIDAESEAEDHHVFYGPHWWKDFVRRPGGEAFVAVEGPDGAVVGFLAVEQRLGAAAYIAWLHVVPAARRQGIGLCLMEHARCKVASAGGGMLSLHVETTNEAALALYRKAGLRVAMTAQGDPELLPNFLDAGRHSYSMELAVAGASDLAIAAGARGAMGRDC